MKIRALVDALNQISMSEGSECETNIDVVAICYVSEKERGAYQESILKKIVLTQRDRI